METVSLDVLHLEATQFKVSITSLR